MDYENSGVLFKNDKKGNEKAPDYAGKINIDGREMRLAAWIKEGKAGKFMSLKISEPMEKKEPVVAKKATSDFSTLDSDIPF